MRSSFLALRLLLARSTRRWRTSYKLFKLVGGVSRSSRLRRLNRLHSSSNKLRRLHNKAAMLVTSLQCSKGRLPLRFSLYPCVKLAQPSLFNSTYLVVYPVQLAVNACVLPSLVFLCSPFAFLWNGVHLLLSPAASHSGWEDHMQSDSFHYMHHR